MQPAPTKMADAILREVQRFQQEFIQCHFFLAANSAMLAELLREAESRGILLHEAFALADVGYWLEHIDWQTRFLSVVLGFVKDPTRKTLRPLIELHGRDRDRMRAEAEILAQQLRHRLDSFAQPAVALVRKAVLKNEKRVLAVHLHVRSGHRGAALARFFKVPRSTAYGWLDWFKMLPEGLQTGILSFMDAQVPSLAARQVPAVLPQTVSPCQAEQPGSAAPVTRTA